MKKIIVCLIPILSLIGCSKSNEVLLPDVGHNTSGPTLRPFATTMLKGQTKTMDVNPYVNSNGSWTLTKVEDPNALVSNITIDSSRFTMTADYAGLTELDWHITENDQSYSSKMLLAVQELQEDNIAPTASPVLLETLSDKSVTYDLSQNIADADGDSLTIGSLVQLSGRFSINGTVITFSPDNFVGYDVAYYSVSDGRGGIAIGQISVVVNDAHPVQPNTKPIAHNQFVTLKQGESLLIQTANWAEDADGDTVVLETLLADSGRAQITGANSITYTAGENFNGEDSFVYIVTDGNGGYAQAVVNVIVEPTQTLEPLSLHPLLLEMTVGESIDFNVTNGVTSAQPWSLKSVSDPSGIVQVGGVTSPSVTFKALSVGVTQMSYTVVTQDETQTGQIFVAVNDASNTPPVARTVIENTSWIEPISINLNNYITDADGDNVVVTELYQAATPARFSTSANNIVAYNPNSFEGVDYTVYVVTDSRGAHGLGQILVNVTGVPDVINNAPTAKNYSQATNSNIDISIDLDALGLINDADNDPLTVTLYSGQQRASLSGHVINYKPNGFVGVDEVVYVVNDGRKGNAIAKVTFSVSDASVINTPPTTTPYTLTLRLADIQANPDVTIDLTTLGVVNDAEGDSLTLTETIASVNPVSISGPLTLNYHASPKVITDSFAYIITDNKGGYSYGLVTVKIENNAPIARSVALAIDPYNTATPSLTIDLNQYASDMDGDELSLVEFSSVESPATLTQDGMVLTYTPNGAVRAESISYTVTDGQLTASSAISIISASTGGLTANSISLGAIAMDAAPVTVDVSPYVTSLNNKAFNLIAVGGMQLGSVTFDSATNSFTYTSKDVNYGIDTFYYTVTDNEGHFAHGLVTISLNAPAKPVITSLDMVYDSSQLIADVSCTDCDISRTDYLFDINGLPIGVNRNTYPLPSMEVVNNAGVVVTVKNRYCTADNTGVAGGNACKYSSGRIINRLSIVTNITANSSAFAARKSDGSVVTWGNSALGGKSDYAQPYLHSVTNVSGTLQTNNSVGAFAARRNDSSYIVWGRRDSTSLYDETQPQLTKVEQIVSNGRGAISVRRSNGAVVTLGEAAYGGDSSSVQTQLTDVIELTASKDSFAALKSDGTVVSWGLQTSGGNSSAVQAQLTNVKKVTSSLQSTCFVALKSDGTVVAWGGEDSSQATMCAAINSSGLTNVSSITVSAKAVAFIHSDGSVTAMGLSGNGGDASAVQSQLVNVKKVFTNGYAFAALKIDGTVVTWGPSSYGGDSSVVTSLLVDVETVIPASSDRMVALRKDGSAVMWGGIFTPSIPEPIPDVKSVTWTANTVALVKNDGTVFYSSRNTNDDALGSLTNVQLLSGSNNSLAALLDDGSIVMIGASAPSTSEVQSRLAPSLVEIYQDLSLN